VGLQLPVYLWYHALYAVLSYAVFVYRMYDMLSWCAVCWRMLAYAAVCMLAHDMRYALWHMLSCGNMSYAKLCQHVVRY